MQMQIIHIKEQQEQVFIAQDFKELQEDENVTFLDLTLEGNPEKLEAKQSNLIPVLVKAIQELSAKVEELESKLNN